MTTRQPMNLCGKSFRTKLEANEWVDRQVVRHVRNIEYHVNVKDVDKVAVKVEVLDKSAAGFEPESGDRPLRILCHVWRQNGLYRVGIPAGEW